MNSVTFRLMQDNGVAGPKQSFDLENPDPNANALRIWARQWSKGQTGHPWDVLTVETTSGLAFEILLTNHSKGD